MKKLILALTIGLVVIMLMPITVTADVLSLRGTLELDSDSAAIEKKKQLKVKGGFERSYKQQPPMVPHSVDKDKITLKGNSCMKCHSEKNHKKEKAPRVGDSHYLDRDGKDLKQLSSRRYFCNQCHAPQQDASELIANRFAGAK